MKIFICSLVVIAFSLNSLQAQCSCSRPDNLTVNKRTKSEREAMEYQPKTAEELVDAQLPTISASLELDPFEEAVVRTTLIKSVKKRKEIQILELEQSEMIEEYEKINLQQKEELKQGLPESKFNAFMALLEEAPKKKKKKREKNQT